MNNILEGEILWSTYKFSVSTIRLMCTLHIGIPVTRWFYYDNIFGSILYIYVQLKLISDIFTWYFRLNCNSPACFQKSKFLVKRERYFSICKKSRSKNVLISHVQAHCARNCLIYLFHVLITPPGGKCFIILSLQISSW
jgi:hypothetical protein